MAQMCAGVNTLLGFRLPQMRQLGSDMQKTQQKQEGNQKSEVRSEDGSSFPSSRPEAGSDADAAPPGFIDRFTWVVSALGGAKAAASAAGLSVSQINRIVSGDSVPKFPHVIRLAEAANADVRWLATGEGPHPSGGPDAIIRRPDHESAVVEAKTSAELADRGEFVLLPRYEVRAGAGGGQIVHSEQVVDHLAFKRDWVLQRLRRDPADLILIEASGDSMADKIRHGDLLLVDTGVERVHDHAIYALNIDGELMVKYVQRLVSGGCRIFSENSKYPPEDLTAQRLQQLSVVGQVIWAGGLL